MPWSLAYSAYSAYSAYYSSAYPTWQDTQRWGSEAYPAYYYIPPNWADMQEKADNVPIVMDAIEAAKPGLARLDVRWCDEEIESEQQTKPTGGKDAATIISLGKRQYQIGNAPPVTVEDNDDTVLQVFLEQATMHGPTLIAKAGFDRAPRVLNALKTKKYGGIFAPAIRCPKKKGTGGYFVNIIKAQV
jgi:hypothetical protein